MKTIPASSLYGSAFEPQLVQGLQSGRITKLLVVMEPQPTRAFTPEFGECWYWNGKFSSFYGFDEWLPFCPFQPGDVLGVKETLVWDNDFGLVFETDRKIPAEDGILCNEDADPPWAIRLRPVVQEIGVVQVSGISDDDALTFGFSQTKDVETVLPEAIRGFPVVVSAAGNLIELWQAQHPGKDWAWVISISNSTERNL